MDKARTPEKINVTADILERRKKLRVGFMGTPDFALAAFKALVEAGFHICCTYSQPPRPKGRGQNVQPSPVQAYSEAQGIPVFTPKSLKTPGAQAEFAAHNLDICVVAAYGLILPEAVLNAPRLGCLNIHASLLPRWRGAAPIQYAIWKGDAQTGVTIMQMDKGLDTGAMIAKRATPILDTTTAAALHDTLALMGAEMIVETLDILAKNGQISAKSQDDSLSNYASMLKKTDGLIDWAEDSAAIDRQIRALNPWPGVWAYTNGVRLKILKAVRVADADLNLANTPSAATQNGEILNRAGVVKCGAGYLQILQLQPDGKKPMDFAAALNGGYVRVGDHFTAAPIEGAGQSAVRGA